MTRWADALAGAIVGRLSELYPAVFIAEVIDAARRRLREGGRA